MTKHSTLVLAVVLAGVFGCGVEASESQEVPPERVDDSVANQSTLDTGTEVTEQSHNNDREALFSALQQGSRGQGRGDFETTGRMFEVPGGWSPWLSPNPDGWENGSTYTFYGTIIGLEGYEEPYYGLVNLRLQARSGSRTFYLGWTTTNFRGSHRSARIDADDRTIGIEVKEQHGYGLIDAKLVTYWNSSWWLTGNPDQNEVHLAYCAPNYELGGIQVKEQHGYGIVNLRIFCKPI